MDTMILQVPISRALKEKAEAVARDYGFSSLQESVRIFLNQLATRKTIVRLEDADEKRLAPRTVRRYAKIVKNIKNGKAKTVAFSDVDSLMNYLNT